MRLRFWRYDLKLTHRWMISSGTGPNGSGGKDYYGVVFLELADEDGTLGLGEAAPSSRYAETPQSTVDFLSRVDATRLSFDDVERSMTYLGSLGPGCYAAKAALNLALLDGFGRRAGKPVHACLGLPFTEGRHQTSFSIGIDTPEMMRAKTLEAVAFPVLKIKLGTPVDRENFQAVREAAPDKWVRVDANEGWKTKEDALRNLEWLAADGRVQFVEQPMPAETAEADMVWLKERSPLPLMADESYLSAKDVGRCVAGFHAVNVKLVKTGGLTRGLEALKTAREAGLKTMLGCMIESSLLVTAAAHLADLTDYLDIDGNLLITNDPFQGATSVGGRLSFVQTPEAIGLRVRLRPA